MDKVLRDLKRALEPLGYEYMGKRHGQSKGAGRGHHVFRDRQNGSVLTTPATPTSPERSRAMTVSRAKKAHAAKTTVSEQWREWLREQYGVGDTDEKIVEWSETKLREQFLAAHPEGRNVTESLFSVALRESDLFETVERGNSHKPGKLLIRGPLAGLTRDDEPGTTQIMCGANKDIPSGGIAVCTRPEGHAGLHFDEFRKFRWHAQTEAPDAVAVDPERDPEPVPAPAAVEDGSGDAGHAGSVGEGDRPEREAASRERPAPPRERMVAAASGVALPEGLAAQLIDALAGDLRAENDLLREVIATAARGLLNAGLELENALRDLGGSAQTASSKGAMSVLGSKRIPLFRQLEAARDDGALPAQFTGQDALAVVDSDNLDAMRSMLSELAKAGVVERLHRGVYQWPE